MAASINDKFTEATNGSRPVPTTLTALLPSGASPGTATCGALTGWPTATAVHFIIYTIDVNGNKVSGSQTDWKGIVSGSTITGLVLKAGTNNGYSIGAVVEAAPTAAWADDLTEGIAVSLDQDGTLKAGAVDVAAVIADAIITNAKMVADTLTEASIKTSQADILRSKNHLINGNMDIWQRNTTAAANDDVYSGADRWNFLTETNGAWTVARDTDVPVGSNYSMKCSNVTLNNQMAIVQILEFADTKKLDDQVVSLSFYAKTSGTEIANLRAAILTWGSTADSVTSDVIGTWGQDGTNPTWATNWTMENTPSNLALTSTWTKYTIENVSIDTATVNNLAVVIWTDDGTIAANDDFWITQVQLNIGSKVAAFQAKSFEEELRACQRYYEKSNKYDSLPSASCGLSNGAAFSPTDYVVICAASTGTAGARTWSTQPYQVQKRTTPTARYWDGAGNVSRNSIGDANIATTYTNQSEAFRAITPFKYGIMYQAAPTSNWFILWTWEADAEL